MKHEFWTDKWSEGTLGFHEAEVHANLLAHAERFLGDGSRRVLVPLCGKSVDMPWLEAQGHSVVGIEFVEKAVKSFFAEQERDYRVEDRDGAPAFVDGKLTVLQSDFFSVRSTQTGAIDRVWDRAAIVAIEPNRRGEYVSKLRELAPGATLLLNCLSYDPAVMDGPPWTISEGDVRKLFGSEVELVDERDVIDKVPFKERGHQYWIVSSYLVQL
jgi:thiopurine S-methyltransferase